MKSPDAGAYMAQRQPAAHREQPPVRSSHDQCAVHLHPLQASIDRSPRMLAQRSAIDAAFGNAIQRQSRGVEDEMPLQARMQVNESPRLVAQRQQFVYAFGPVAQREATNLTGMPNQLKSGIEALSGVDMSDVRVHRNSSRPAQLNAHAYAQGQDIHLAPGQEQHLPHEAWHVVQQAQGRVRPTMQMAGGVALNDDLGLEREADVMGEKAKSRPVQLRGDGKRQDLNPDPLFEFAATQSVGLPPVQRMSIQKGYQGADKAEHLGEHSPFQLATIQFEATYDLNLYQQHILAYIATTPVEKIPVIELRAYDSAPKHAIGHYLDAAADIIGQWNKDKKPFIVRYKTLRDETINPVNSPADDSEGELKTLERIEALMNDKLDLEAGEKPAFIKHNAELANPKKQIAEGNLMVPAPEFSELTERTDPELTQIWLGKAQQKHSLHVRVLAKSILDSRASGGNSQSSAQQDQSEGKSEGAKGAQEQAVSNRRLARSNSITKPAVLTITNLVAGDEQMTRGVVVQAVTAAFKKDVQTVLLTVEHKGTGQGAWNRISNQIDALREARFRVESIQTIADGTGAKAQQSGLRKDEPSDTAPARSILKITRETSSALPDDVSRYIAEHKLEDAYLKWYANMIHADTREAMDTVSITGRQFLIETQGLI